MHRVSKAIICFIFITFISYTVVCSSIIVVTATDINSEIVNLALTTADNSKKRADLQLIAMIKDAQSQLAANNIKTADKVFLSGYSASAKFAQRFAIIHPDMVRALAAGGIAGTTVLPFVKYDGTSLRYPVGIFDFKELTGKEFVLETYKKVDQYLYMGGIDTNDATQFRDCFEE